MFPRRRPPTRASAGATPRPTPAASGAVSSLVAHGGRGAPRPAGGAPSPWTTVAHPHGQLEEEEAAALPNTGTKSRSAPLPTRGDAEGLRVQQHITADSTPSPYSPLPVASCW